MSMLRAVVGVEDDGMAIVRNLALDRRQTMSRKTVPRRGSVVCPMMSKATQTTERI